MKRIAHNPRPDWKKTAEEAGFSFHTMHGEPYWDEDTVYEFTLEEVETRLEDPSTELHEMCRQAVDTVVNSEELMTRLAIPREHWDLVANSWKSDDPELYGRFDLIYDGQGSAKMMEYNADTPTSLYEAASFQWKWLEDQIARGVLPADADQFNRIFEALTERFAEIFPQGTDIHFSSFKDALEDYATTECIAYAAREAGMGAHYTEIEGIGVTENGQFADSDSRIIGNLFKLYPWEDMLRDDFAGHIAGAHCTYLEPAWKAIVSNKGLLPVLWNMFEGHDNLLPTFFAQDIHDGAPEAARASEYLAGGSVTKPIFSREGASITIEKDGKILEAAENRTYDDHPMIVQGYHALPLLDGFRPIIGTWVVGRTCVGMGVREDRSRITQDLSRFKPHFITG
jgi:glutathionylspermidine synthase